MIRKKQTGTERFIKIKYVLKIYLRKPGAYLHQGFFSVTTGR
jgi:hypothetical protein